MPRRNLDQTEGLVLHVINRGVRRARLFEQPEDYDAFLRALDEGRRRTGMRVLAYCVMPNHFHLVVWPRKRGQLPAFMAWFQGTHSKRWHRARGTTGTGPVYQGRYRAFPVQTDAHFLTVCRYVERNPVRAKLVARARDWRWSSFAERSRAGAARLTAEWPIPPPETWEASLDVAEPDLMAVREALNRGISFGPDDWAEAIDRRLAVHGRRRPGRPLGRLQSSRNRTRVSF